MFLFSINKRTAIIKTQLLNSGKSIHGIHIGSKVAMKWGSHLQGSSACQLRKRKINLSVYLFIYSFVYLCNYYYFSTFI